MTFNEFLSDGMNISFDFDDTLRINAMDVFEKNFPREAYIKKMRDHISEGDNVFILTSRDETKENLDDIRHFLSKYNLNEIDIHFTNGDLKANKAQELDVSLHYDDDPDELNALKAKGIKTVDTDDDELKRFYKKYFRALDND